VRDDRTPGQDPFESAWPREVAAVSAESAAEALERLGLSGYEAKVFVALQQLGEGTAQEVSRVSDVPRSQVYGAAGALAERGLVELVETSPKRYRPVSLAAARRQLSARLEREQDRAFEHLESVREEHDDDHSGTEVATLRGRRPIHERLAGLLADADERIIAILPTEREVSADVGAQLRDRAADGVEVTLVTEDPAVADRFEDSAVRAATAGDEMTDFTGRTVLVDGATVLLSVVPAGRGGETALWTAETAIGEILAAFVHTGMQAGMDAMESAE